MKAGDVLAELEHADLDAMLESRKVAVALAEAQVAEAKFNVEQAERDYARQKDLAKRKAGITADLEKAQTARDANKMILQAREASVAAPHDLRVEVEQEGRGLERKPFDRHETRADLVPERWRDERRRVLRPCPRQVQGQRQLD